MIKRLLSDLYHTLCGKDGKLSLRRILAIVFAGALVHLSVIHITTCREVQEGFIWAFVSLIAALLSLTTYQTITYGNKSGANKGDQRGDSEQDVH